MESRTILLQFLLIQQEALNRSLCHLLQRDVPLYQEKRRGGTHRDGNETEGGGERGRKGEGVAYGIRAEKRNMYLSIYLFCD